MSHSHATLPAGRPAPDPAAARASRSPPNARHSRPTAPSAWIARWLERLPRGATVLDLAAGSGRHLQLACSLGLRALGVDRDGEALAAAISRIQSQGEGSERSAAANPATGGPRHSPTEPTTRSHRAGEEGQVDGLVLDLERGPWPLARGAFDAVVVASYLFRPRFALVCDLLAPGGLLIYETFGLGNEAYGRPSNPSFLLREGELLDRVKAAGLIVLAYESGYTDTPKPAIVQRICAARPPVDGGRLSLG